MNTLERRYRRVLRLLPAPYRARWEEEMVEAFLASVETDDPERAEYVAEFGRPRLAEVASVVLLSVRLRLGLAGTPTPRSLIWGGAFRIVALCWLLTGAAMATAFTAERVRALGRPLYDDLAVEPPVFVTLSAWDLASMLWVVAFAAALFGRLRVARGLAVLLVLSTAFTRTLESLAGAPEFWWYGGPSIVVEVCLLATLWTLNPTVRPWWGPWILAWLGGVALMLAYLAAPTTALAWGIVDSAGLYTIVLVPAAMVQLARPRRDPAWSLALAVMIGITLIRVLGALPGVLNIPPEFVMAPLVAAVVEVAALVLAGALMVVVSVRALARLEPDPHRTIAG